MRVRPDKEQATSFENFHQTSSNMAKMLIAQLRASQFPPIRWRAWIRSMINSRR